MDVCTDVQVKAEVCDGKRPEIPNYVPQAWKKLIQDCWQDNPALRPTAQQVVTVITDTLEHDLVFA